MKIVVWSKYNCSYCESAKKLLDQKSLVYEERKIGDGWTRDDLLESVPDARSVPQIFIDGVLVGGYDRLLEYFESQQTLTPERNT